MAQPPPAIDYTNKDYASLRAAMLDLARYRLPEWTDRSASDLGMLMVDLFAYMGDVLLYYQDRIANEAFLHTAVERRSVMHALRLIGYELAPPVAATAELLLTFRAPPAQGSPLVTVPHGAQFATRAVNGVSLPFVYLGPDLTLDLTSDQVEALPDGRRIYAGLPVRQGQHVPTEVIGSSTGEPNLRFALSRAPLLPESLVVEGQEGAGWVTWHRRESLVLGLAPDGQVTASGPEARHYTLQFDEKDTAWVLFGDGVSGRKPPVGLNNIRASYHVGGGAAGNVPAGSITEARTPISLLESVTQPQPAAGGADAESTEHAVRFGPQAFRSAGRAVTVSDYVALAHQAGGVAKARARSQGWNEVALYVAPQGGSWRPVPEALKRHLLSFFEDKRMAGTFVRILDATPVRIDVAMEVLHQPSHRAEAVRQTVESTVRALLAYERVDFGMPVYLSDLYSAVEAVPGVLAVTVTRFRRRDAGDSEIEAELRRLNLPPLEQLPEVLRRGLSLDVAPEGRIDLDDFELPEPGTLEVAVKATAR
ncbi:baseplate J/gp47 family protein [Myxococcus sp. RHSTA-1-4]|uniref:baseplate J/gp47 family protein n=1 Tax=Myxococcus sp. RHSTA-1-4 TaxID=2874601 RepID=UPI001CBD29CD|nr:baseplate J/gp47 family protein [Myxococcus sp. RHSTA-1-4]MBZ4417428.1 baseplate J/gp47 family protein [Myxococcus sp. RHSTA-1-4]